MKSIKRLVESYLFEDGEVQFKTDNGTSVSIKQDGNGYYWDDGQSTDPARWDDPIKAQKSYFDQKSLDENKLNNMLLDKFGELDDFIRENNINLDIPYNQMRADPKIDELAGNIGMDSIEFLDKYLAYRGKN